MITTELIDLTRLHIEELIGVEESSTLDFKSQVPSTREGRLEFAKDVSALANTRGGHLVFGIVEGVGGRQGIAERVVPLQFEPDALILALTSSLADNLEPRLHGVGFKHVDIDDGRVLIVKVPRSAFGVHRCRDGQFYVREARSNLPLSVSGITNRFRDILGYEDRVQSFFAGRYASTMNDLHSIPFGPGPKLVVHTFPLRDFLQGEEISLAEIAADGQFPMLGFTGAGGGGFDSTMTHEGIAYTAQAAPVSAELLL